MSKQYTIGIDPGAHCGIAVYSRALRQIIRAETLDFWSAFDLCIAEYPPETCDVIVEDCSKNKPRFRHKEGFGVQDRMSRNVGAVQRESVLLIDGLRRRGYNVIAERPQSAKWDAETVKRVTGWSKRTSAHCRDAIKLCFGVQSVRVIKEAA